MDLLPWERSDHWRHDRLRIYPVLLLIQSIPSLVLLIWAVVDILTRLSLFSFHFYMLVI